MREIAIIHTEAKNSIGQGLLGKFNLDDKITVFCKNGLEFNCSTNVTTIDIPEELNGKDASIRNFVSKHYTDGNFKGFLHVFSDSVEIFGDIEGFFPKIEEMMDKLELKSWFNTATDPCNYNFKLYTPRIFIDIDREDVKKVYDKRIYWTSHANTSYVVYDFSKATYEDVRFEDRFTIAMFYIIEFLARRRNTKGVNELNYMNFYPSIKEELGIFRLREEKWPPEQKTQREIKEEQEKMDVENGIFQEMHVNNAADQSIEQIIEDMYAVLSKKIA